jgi:hypothetical protein
MMECPVCGARNESGAGFCFRCGTPLKGATPAATGPTVNLNRVEAPQQPDYAAQPADANNARVYDAPSATNTHQPFTVPTGSAPSYTPPGQYGAGAGAYPVTSTSAILALVLGIASFVGLSILGAIPAIILGRNARQEIQASGGRITGEGIAQAGIVLGWINVALSVLAMCFFCAAFLIPFLGLLGTSTSP